MSVGRAAHDQGFLPLVVQPQPQPPAAGPLSALVDQRGNRHSFTDDALGSTTFLTNAAGNVADTFAYDASVPPNHPPATQ